MSTPKTPGIFFVNSKITTPSLSHETFTKWYEQIHIPDIFKTSGIRSAFRYYSTAPQNKEKPYLAIYPLDDVGFLETKEFWSIPVAHEMLDEAGGKEGTTSFEVAEFDTRPYELVKVTQLETAGKGPAPFLVLLQFDTPGSELENLPFLPVREGIRRTRLCRTHWREKNSLPQQREPGFAPEYLALLEVETEMMAEAFEAEKETFKAKVGCFRLVGAFGQVEAAY